MNTLLKQRMEHIQHLLNLWGGQEEWLVIVDHKIGVLHFPWNAINHML